MKNISNIFAILAVLLFLPATLSSQVHKTDTISEDELQSFDNKVHFLIGLGNDFVQDIPEGTNVRNYNPSFVTSIMLDMPIGNSPLSFGAGLGLQTHNIHSNAKISEKANGNTEFEPLHDSLNYSKNKLSLSYLELPVELRLRLGADNSYTLALGFKAGYLIESHIKYKGDNYLENNVTTKNKEVKIKEYSIPNVNKFRYTATARIGLKNITLFGHYNLKPVFEKNTLVSSENGNSSSNVTAITAGLLLSF